MLNKKNEKIFVDLDDEITFVFERIKSSDADRIVLVAPEGAAIISSLVSLKLLSKLVFKKGKSLVLVTTDDSGIRFAKKAGIPVINRITNLNEDIWTSSEERLKKRGMYPVLGRKEITKDEQKSLESKEQGSTSLNAAEDENIADVRNQDKISEEKITDEISQNDSEAEKQPTLQDFGFVVGRDIAKEKQEEIDEKLNKERYVNHTFQNEKSETETFTQHNQRTKEFIEPEEEYQQPVYEREKQRKRFRLPKLPGVSLPKIGWKFFIPLVALLALLVGVGGVYAYFIAPTASVDLIVKFQKVDLEKEIIATTDISDVDLGNLQIPLMTQEVEENGSDSAAATGREVRGEKAKGKITIVNKTEETIQLAASSVLTGAGYNFLLISDEEIPAADIFAGTLGRAEVDVEAYDIGEEYNLTTGNEFSIEGYLTGALVGKNFDQFSGGTKEEVTIVTAQDQEELKNRLQQSLEERVKNSVKNQVGEGLVLNENMIEIETVEEHFDATVGSETDSMNLTMKVKAKGHVYSIGDFKTLAVQLLQQEIKSGLKLLEDESEFDGEFLRKENSTAVLKLIVKGVIVGDVDEEQIKESLAGKSLEEADAELSSLEAIDDYKIITGPEWLPEMFRHIPSIKGKITVNLIINNEEEQ